ncbi:MAG: VOC family protein [Myxococcaceae bacterium]
MTKIKNTICWVDIPVSDLDRALLFYGAVLNVQLEKQTHGEMSFVVLPHDDQTVGGCLVISSDAQPSKNGPLVYLSVEGRLNDALEQAEKQGGKILEGKHPIGPYGFRGIVLDSEGNRIALHHGN